MASTINISLPEPLMAYVDAQVDAGLFGTPGQYISDLIANDRDRRRRNLDEHLLDALAHRDDFIEVPDDVWESGDIVGYLESHLEPTK